MKEYESCESDLASVRKIVRARLRTATGSFGAATRPATAPTATSTAAAVLAIATVAATATATTTELTVAARTEVATTAATAAELAIATATESAATTVPAGHLVEAVVGWCGDVGRDGAAVGLVTRRFGVPRFSGLVASGQLVRWGLVGPIEPLRLLRRIGGSSRGNVNLLGRTRYDLVAFLKTALLRGTSSLGVPVLTRSVAGDIANVGRSS